MKGSPEIRKGITTLPQSMHVGSNTVYLCIITEEVTSVENRPSGSQFHAIVLWSGGVKAHCDLLSDVMFRMAVKMGAAKVVWVPALWVGPPTTD